jgi:hypothetical protein
MGHRGGASRSASPENLRRTESSSSVPTRQSLSAIRLVTTDVGAVVVKQSWLTLVKGAPRYGGVASTDAQPFASR